MATDGHINPRMLAWARETAGLSPEAAAEKLGLKTTAKATGAEKLIEAENSRRPVSRGVLQKAAATYHRPLTTFYLREPPSRGERGQDFRAVSSVRPPRDDAMLDALIRDVRSRQQLVREILIEEEDAKQLPLVGASLVSDGAETVARSIREALSVNLEDQLRAKNPAALFALLRNAAERAGIFVLLLGDLGSHHSDVGEDTFRGFALADTIAPFLVINDNDAVTARSFTLIHEMAHLWIGASGVSGPLSGMPENKVERFCNEVAGEFLLPPEAIIKLATVPDLNPEQAVKVTAEIAQRWNVSQAVVTYRLLANGRISGKVAAQLFRMLAERWRLERQNTRASRDPGELGPGFYVVRRSRLGARLLSVVRRALQEDVLTHTKAARILGIAPAGVNQLLGEGTRAS